MSSRSTTTWAIRATSASSWRCRSTRGRRSRRGSRAIAETISLALQTARGLAAAHARGIIHREVKPANLIVAAGDVVKIFDFGIAKLAGTALSAPGFAPGTAAYMSPEHSRADAPEALTQVVRAMMAKDPGDHPASAEMVATQLESIAA